MMDWQPRLHTAIEGSALPPSEIEKVAKVSRGTIRQLLRTDEKAPKTGPGIRTAQAIADALGVSAGWLWFGEPRLKPAHQCHAHQHAPQRIGDCVGPPPFWRTVEPDDRAEYQRSRGFED